MDACLVVEVLRNKDKVRWSEEYEGRRKTCGMGDVAKTEVMQYIM